MSDHRDRSATRPDPAWLATWRRDIDAATATLLAGFEQRFGYPPGQNAIHAPGPDDLAAAAQLARLPVVAASLPPFYGHIGEVVLADVGNAYFIHPASHVLGDLTECGPIALAPGPAAPFASDGGGIQFAIAADGTVHRSAAASRDSAFHRVADDLQHFLDQLRHAVLRFVETGQPGDL